MQPKNSSKSSPAKVAQVSKETLTIKNNGLKLKIVKHSADLKKSDEKSIFVYTPGITGNCQIGSLALVEPELFYEWAKTTDSNPLNSISDNLFMHINNAFKSCSNHRRMTFFSFRTKFIPKEVIDKISGKYIIEASFEYIENRCKYTKLLINLYN